MRVRRVLSIVILLVVISSIVSAQTPAPTQRPPVEREFFSLGGRSDHLLLYLQTNAGLNGLIKASLEHSFNTFQPLFGEAGNIPFQIVIWGTDNPSRGDVRLPNGSIAHALATTNYADKALVVADFPLADTVGNILDPKVCYIQLHVGFFATTKKQSTIAHELSHCYQLFYIPSASVKVANDADRWWMEGSANWLASIAFPAEFPLPASMLFRYTYDVLTSAYSNHYFWSFIASPEGAGSTEAAIAYMKTIGTDPQFYPADVERLNPAQPSVEIFHRWMFALIEGRIPFDPPINLHGFSVRAVVNDQARFNTSRFSGDRAKVVGIKVDPGNKAVVTATALLDNNYAVSAKIGSSWVRLPNGHEVEFCPQNGALELLISRGSSPIEDKPDFTLIFSQKESDAPCVAKPPDATAASTCMVGAWVVTAFPPSILGGNSFEIDLSKYVYFFHDDGTYSGTWGITAIPEKNASLTISIPFEGTYSVTPVADRAGSYAVDSFTLSWLPGGTAVLKTAGGQESSVGQVYYSSFQRYGTSAWEPSGTLSCYEDEMSWMSIPGYTWTLERLAD